MTWEMIRAEFGGPTPIAINQYYKGGALVPNTAQNVNVPASGAISASHFYGAGATVPPMVSISDQSIRRSLLGGQITLGYDLRSNGEAWQLKDSGNSRIVGEWLLSGAAGDYDAKYAVVGGIAGNLPSHINAGSTLTTAYQSLGTGRFISLTWGSGDLQGWTLRVSIRKISTGVELDFADILLERY